MPAFLLYQYAYPIAEVVLKELVHGVDHAQLTVTCKEYFAANGYNGNTAGADIFSCLGYLFCFASVRPMQIS